jgi:hypothetical protein
MLYMRTASVQLSKISCSSSDFAPNRLTAYYTNHDLVSTLVSQH